MVSMDRSSFELIRASAAEVVTMVATSASWGVKSDMRGLSGRNQGPGKRAGRMPET